MKLSNLSLAILIGLGVAACGGSDDNTNQTQDPPPGNNNGGGNNGGGNTTPPPVDNTKPQDPTRVAPGMNVEPQIADIVKARKMTYADNGTRELLIGYAPNDGVVSRNRDPYGQAAGSEGIGKDYVADATDPKDIKRLSSRVNYAEDGQFYKNSPTPGHNGAVIANPGFTYALGSDKQWHRMKPAVEVPNPNYDDQQPVGPGNMPTMIVHNWTITTADTKYVPVDNNMDGQFPVGGVDQNALFYIPNVVVTNTELGPNGDGTEAGEANGKRVGLNVVRTANHFDLAEDKVQFSTAEFLGKSYDIRSVGKIDKVDLNDIPVNKNEVQYHNVKINYSIVDSKLTSNQTDDANTARSAKAGAMKAYNLPYSLAFVTVNQAAAEKKRYEGNADGEKARARNLFDYSTGSSNGDWGAYQVKGFQSTALPRNGRADYHGKSFGSDSIGDIHLRADFSTNGAHVEGVVTNRTRADGKLELPNIDLAGILLSAETGRNYTGTNAFGPAASKAAPGAATSRSANGTWHVQFFGPNAEEAGGSIFIDNNAIIPEGREVFTSQRGALTDASNLAPTP